MTSDPAENESFSASTTKEFAIRSLEAMELNEADIKSFTAGMGIKGYSALANFHVACEHFNLPVAWGPKQVKAFLIFINYKYYAASYVARMWITIRRLGKLLLQPITEKQEADFELVYQQAKEIKDNKVPVSKSLLAELCKAADKVFAPYNAALAKAVFLAAWGGYMWVSEYSRTSGKDGNKHNLKEDALITSPAGLSITFRSDKTSKASDPYKHRFVSWKSLPSGARQAFQQYDKLRSKKTINYFCREDGVELTRNSVLNLLDTCLLLTSFSQLTVTPHCFRLGAASHDRLHGLSITDILIKGRWKPQSKAIEAYTRPDMVVLKPEDLYNQLPKYHRAWSHQKLCFLARCIVEIPAKDEVHPFQAALDKNFPEIRFYKDKLPEHYPHEFSLQRQAELQENRRTKVYLRIMEEEEAKKIRECFSRGKSASLLRKESNKRIKEGGSLPFAYSTPSAIAGVSVNKQVQTYQSVAMAGTQTDHVVVLTSGEAQQLALTAVVQVPGVPIVPARTSLQEKITFSAPSAKLYDVTSLGSRMALTKEQLASRKKSDPDLQVKSRSLSATQKFQLRAKIRRRISRKYREHRNDSRVNVSQRKHPHQGPIPKSPTII